MIEAAGRDTPPVVNLITKNRDWQIPSPREDDLMVRAIDSGPCPEKIQGVGIPSDKFRYFMALKSTGSNLASSSIRTSVPCVRLPTVSGARRL